MKYNFPVKNAGVQDAFLWERRLPMSPHWKSTRGRRSKHSDSDNSPSFRWRCAVIASACLVALFNPLSVPASRLNKRIGGLDALKARRADVRRDESGACLTVPLTAFIAYFKKSNFFISASSWKLPCISIKPGKLLILRHLQLAVFPCIYNSLILKSSSNRPARNIINNWLWRKRHVGEVFSGEAQRFCPFLLLFFMHSKCPNLASESRCG